MAWASAADAGAVPKVQLGLNAQSPDHTRSALRSAVMCFTYVGFDQMGLRSVKAGLVVLAAPYGRRTYADATTRTLVGVNSTRWAVDWGRQNCTACGATGRADGFGTQASHFQTDMDVWTPVSHRFHRVARTSGQMAIRHRYRNARQ